METKNKSKVSIILAIVAVIVSSVAGVLFYLNLKSKEKVSLISAQDYIVTLNSMAYYYNSTPMEKKIVDGVYDVSELDVNTYNNPKSGYVVLNNGKVTEASLKYDKVVNYENDAYTTSSSEKTTPAKNIQSKELENFCDVVVAYSDRAISKGDKYSCDPGDGKKRTFYVIDVTDNNATLIMDRNLGGNVPWCKADGSNPYSKNCNGDGANYFLKLRTANWKNVAVDLPSLEQIMGVNNVSFSFDNYPFLYNSGDNATYCNVSDSGCVEKFGDETTDNTYGYWLKESSWLGVDTAFEVEFDNHTIFYTEVGNSNRLGIRPVIVVNRR